MLPYRNPLLNRVEFGSLAVAFFTLAFALFFTDSGLSTAAEQTIAVLLVCMHAAFLAVLVAAVVRSAKCCARCGGGRQQRGMLNRADGGSDALHVPLRDEEAE